MTMFRCSLVFSLSLCCACATVYIPPAAHAPLLSDEGEVSVGALAGTNGVDLQVAAAVASHVVVVAQGSINIGKENNHAYADVGAGYFLPFGIGRFEALAGGGGGVSRAQVNVANSVVVRQGYYGRGWVQATVGLSTPIVDAALVNRLQYTNYTYTSPNSIRDADAFFWEPVAVLRLGYKFIKGELQGGTSLPLSSPSGTTPGWLPVHVVLGIRGTLDFWGEGEVHIPWATERDDDD